RQGGIGVLEAERRGLIIVHERPPDDGGLAMGRSSASNGESARAPAGRSALVPSRNRWRARVTRPEKVNIQAMMATTMKPRAIHARKGRLKVSTSRYVHTLYIPRGKTRPQ